MIAFIKVIALSFGRFKAKGYEHIHLQKFKRESKIVCGRITIRSTGKIEKVFQIRSSTSKIKIMREIKFRGKRKNGTEWLVGDFVRTCNGGPCIFSNDESLLVFHSPDWFEVDPETVGQFIGLKDIKGKDIFEGDLIAEVNKMEELDKWGTPLTVCFGEYVGNNDSWGIPDVTTGFYLKYNEGNSKDQQTGIHNRETGYGFESKEIMVVGNIYDNHELTLW